MRCVHTGDLYELVLDVFIYLYLCEVPELKKRLGFRDPPNFSPPHDPASRLSHPSLSTPRQCALCISPFTTPPFREPADYLKRRMTMPPGRLPYRIRPKTGPALSAYGLVTARFPPLSFPDTRTGPLLPTPSPFSTGKLPSGSGLVPLDFANLFDPKSYDYHCRVFSLSKPVCASPFTDGKCRLVEFFDDVVTPILTAFCFFCCFVC